MPPEGTPSPASLAHRTAGTARRETGGPIGTRRRLSVLFAAGVIVSTVVLVAVEHAQRRQTELLFQERTAEVGRTLGSVLALEQRSLRSHVEDYSRWDEFVAYVAHPSTTWTTLNLGESLRPFGVDEVWVLDRGLRPLYAANVHDDPVRPAPPVPTPTLRAALLRDPFLHCYVPVAGGWLELRSAPIQPTADVARAEPARGYYVVARRWNHDLLTEIGDASGGIASVLPARLARTDMNAARTAGRVEVRVPLPGIDGRPVAALRLVTGFPLVGELARGARMALASLAVAALLATLGSFLLLTRWVARPLQSISTSLGAGSAEAIAGLRGRRDEFGRIAALIVEFFDQKQRLTEDLAELTRARHEIERQAVLIRQVIDTDPNPIWVTDPDERVVLANESAAAIFGRATSTLIGQRLHDLLPATAEAAALLDGNRKAVDMDATLVSDETLEGADGHRMRFEVIRCPIRRPGGTRELLSILVDVSARERTQDALRSARDAAEAGARAKSQFLANVSHELRTPMHGILSYARFGMREAAVAERGTLGDYFTNISECGESLMALLNDLLDLARMESGRMSFAFDAVDVGDLLGSAVNEFEGMAQEADVALLLDCPEGLILAGADRMKLLQVTRNLFSNAIKFSPPGGTIEVGARATERGVRVSVRDHGIGIPEDELELVFDKFVQSSKTRSGSGGTGLGLAICREVVVAHGGRIWAEAAPEGGTTFVMDLPGREPARAAAA